MGILLAHARDEWNNFNGKYAPEAEKTRMRTAFFTRVPGNLVPRAHVPSGQHQDTELWNNQQARSQSLRGFCF